MLKPFPSRTPKTGAEDTIETELAHFSNESKNLNNVSMFHQELYKLKYRYFVLFPG